MFHIFRGGSLLSNDRKAAVFFFYHNFALSHTYALFCWFGCVYISKCTKLV